MNLLLNPDSQSLDFVHGSNYAAPWFGEKTSKQTELGGEWPQKFSLGWLLIN